MGPEMLRSLTSRHFEFIIRSFVINHCRDSCRTKFQRNLSKYSREYYAETCYDTYVV